MLNAKDFGPARFPSASLARDAAVLYAPSLAFLILSLSPFLLIRFAHHDDWNLFNANFRSSQWVYELAAGRPFFAVFLKLAVFPYVRDLGGLLYGRIIIIAAFALALSVFAAYLCRRGLHLVMAFCTSALIFSLPGVQQRVSHVISLPAVIGILLALLAGIVTTEHGPRLVPRRGYRSMDVLRALAIVGALALSFLTYQSSPMFFLLPVFADALFGSEADYRARMERAFLRSGTFIVGLMLCFFAYKFAALPILAKRLPAVLHPIGPGYQLDLSSEIPHRLWQALTDWLPLEARLWFLEWPGAPLVVAGAIVFGILARAAASVRHSSTQNGGRTAPLWALGCAIFLTVVANSPSIASEAGGGFARLMFPASAVLVILLVWIGAEALPGRVFNIVLIVLVIAAGIAAHVRVFYMAENASIEYELMRDAVGRLAQVTGPIKELLLIKAPGDRAYVGPPPFADEFDFLSSVSCGNMEFMYYHAISDRLAPPEIHALKQDALLLYDPACDPPPCNKGIFYLSSEAVILDPSAPMYLPNNPASCIDGIARYSATPVPDHHHSPSAAFGDDGEDFWEARSYPVVLNISYPRRETIISYFLGAGEGAPTAWRFEASNDQLTWIELDAHSDGVEWAARKPVKFPIVHPGAYRNYRLIFTRGTP